MTKSKIRKKSARRPARKKRPLKKWEIKKKAGKKKLEVNLAQVRRLAAFMGTEEEIAVMLGMCYATFKIRKSENPQVQIAIDEGRAKGRVRLRSKQMQTALKGSVPMQIFLGKQYLDQTEKAKVEGEHKHLMTFTPDISKPDNATGN